MITDVLLIVLFIFDFSLIYMIYFYNPSGTINRFLSLMIIPIMLSNIEMLLLRSVETSMSLNIGLNMAFLGGLSFFPLFFHFSFYYPRNSMNGRLKTQIALVYAMTVVLGLVLFFAYLLSPETVSEMEILNFFRLFKRNPFFFMVYILTLLYTFTLLSLTIWKFSKSYKLNLMHGERRNIVLIIAGFIPTSIALLFSYFIFLPLRSGMKFYIITSAFYTVFFIILLFSFSYLDRKAAVRTLFTYPVTVIIIFILFDYGLSDLNTFLTRLLGLELEILLIAEILILLLLLQPLVRLFEVRLAKGVSNPSGGFHKTLKEASARMVELISLDELGRFLNALFKDNLKFKEFYLFIQNPVTMDYTVIGDNGGDELTFPGGGELAAKLSGSRRVLNIQQIALAWHEGDELTVLADKDIVLIAPLFEHEELAGFCLFGEPGPARAWYPSEIEELETFVSGLPIVLARCNTHDRAILLEKKQAAIEKMAVLNEISSGIAHEIRNPLSIIAASAETIFERELSTEEIKRFAVYIQDETQRMSRLLNRILSISVTSEVKHQPVNVITVMQRALDLVSAKLRKKNIIIDFQNDAEACVAVIDKEVLMQVCLNLVLNAIDAMSDGMRLRVEAEYYGTNRVKITFANEGDKIPADIRNRIFDPFFTTKKSGTGLGLSITHRLIKDASGEIKLINSEDETIFQILLPSSVEFMR